MKKLFLSSLAVLASASAASAATVNPYIGLHAGYEHATYNDIVFKGSYVAGEESGSFKEHMGNIMGDGFTSSVTAGLESHVNCWLDLRAELEYMYSRNNNMTWKHMEDDGKHKTAFDAYTHALLLNGYAGFHNITPFTPYLTAGLGYAWADGRTDTHDEDYKFHIRDKGFAWQVGAGVSYSVTKALSLDLGYRFVKLADASKKMVESDEYMDEETGEVVTNSMNAKLGIEPMLHQVRLGARYAF